MIQSKALEVNLASYRVDVTINPEYLVLQDVMSGYYGLAEGVHTFLKELSHPYKNWEFIVKEARNYSLDYIHLLKSHSRGPDAVDMFVDIFLDAVRSAGSAEVKRDAVDNLLLFLQKLIKASGLKIEAFIPVLNRAFQRIESLKGDDFSLLLKSFYQLNRLANNLLEACADWQVDYQPINALLLKYYREIYAYWLGEEDPQKWFEGDLGETEGSEELADIFKNISHRYLLQWKNRLEEIFQDKELKPEEILQRLIEIPAYNHFVESYRKTPQRLFRAGEALGRGNRWKLIFIFHIMKVSGLSMIHEEALRDVNKTLTWLIGNEGERLVQQLVEKTFSILKEVTSRFPATALNCILNMGDAIYKTDESELVNYFIDSVIDLGFQAPMIGGVGDDWQIKANAVHIKNIRTWLNIIELNPKWSTRLISALIIHLSLSGVFIKDTDLFPRDITRFLNSDISPVYNLSKQLTRLFPAYFNDIGAEGELREISTEIDEICHRKDVLIHFLRKQSHVESSNRIVYFMRAVFDFWRRKNKTGLKPFIPPNIYDQIDTSGEYIDGIHHLIKGLSRKGISFPDGVIHLEEPEISALFDVGPGVSQTDVQRVKLAVAFYKLVNQKYNLSFIEMDHYLAQLRAQAFPDLKNLQDALAETDLKKRLFKLIDYLERLKELILSSESYEVREDIYKKRHITVDIPSMYGSYREFKFDALGLTFRIESIINVLFEELVEGIDLGLITKATFFEVYDCLKLFDKALKLDGIFSVEIEGQLDFLAHSLEVRGFTFTQYLDIFKGFTQAVKNIVNDYFNNVHELNLDRILSRTTTDRIRKRYLPRQRDFDQEKLRHRVSEIFFRERIAHSLGLQQLDLLLSRILNTLFQQSDKVPKDYLQPLLLYDHKRAISSIGGAKNGMSGIIHLGNKGLNMVKLRRYGLPVPPGFIITTEVFRSREVINSYAPAELNLKEQIVQHIRKLEKITGKSFGRPKNPLLFSVRSGSAISQPGMMDTFLDVGMNEEITMGMIALTGNAWFAWDNYRRFLQCYGMSFGLERDDFDAVMVEYKQKWGIEYKRRFSGQQMQELALAYKNRVRDSQIDIEERPFEQLYLIVKKVFDSWESSKAKTYRKIMGISEDWGTAATVQAMVYGNFSDKSGTGVIFTHNPRWSGDTLRLWGDFTMENQGEDVVSGLVKTLPVSIFQQEIELRDTDITLETHYPEVYAALKKWANFLIYEKGWGPQEMEFTFEKPDVKNLYLLQTRDMAIRERKKVFTFDLEGISDERLLSRGIGVSGGAMSGRLVFSLDEIDQWRKQEPHTALILARNDTVPDDIREIYAADALLTARGGLTSHAAVVAHRLGKTCVVGCGSLLCEEKEKSCLFQQSRLISGDFISIDGQLGSVYRGRIKLKEA